MARWANLVRLPRPLNAPHSVRETNPMVSWEVLMVAPFDQPLARNEPNGYLGVSSRGLSAREGGAERTEQRRRTNPMVLWGFLLRTSADRNPRETNPMVFWGVSPD